MPECAGIFASRRNFIYPVAVTMSEFLNRFTHTTQFFLTNRAINDFVVTSVFGTSRGNFIFSDRRFRVPRRGSFTSFVMVAFFANSAFFAFGFAPRCHSLSPFTVTMSKRINCFSQQRFMANRTFFMLASRCRTSGFGVNDPVAFRMFRRGNYQR